MVESSVDWWDMQMVDMSVVMMVDHWVVKKEMWMVASKVVMMVELKAV